MIFGNAHNFAIEAFHEPSGPGWHGFGRLCLHIQGIQIGDIHDKHCSLFNITRRFRELIENIHLLWDSEFAGLSDTEIFAIVDRELYIGGPTENRSRYTAFDFLTNDGEMLNNVKTFILCRPQGEVHILFQFRDLEIHSRSCSVGSFRQVAKAYVEWFDQQLITPVPQYFPVD